MSDWAIERAKKIVEDAQHLCLEHGLEMLAEVLRETREEGVREAGLRVSAAALGEYLRLYPEHNQAPFGAWQAHQELQRVLADK